MDNTQPTAQAAPPVVTQPVVQAQPVVAPVVPISDQPLTLDPNQMSTPTPQPQPAAPQATTPVPPAQPLPQPQYPIGGPHKEAAPIPQALPTEYMRPTESAPKLPPEVAEAGIEVVENQEQPQLGIEHKSAGIEAAKEAAPMTISQQPAAQLPYTFLEAKQIGKATSVNESKHWLAAFTEYLLKKIQEVTG